MPAPRATLATLVSSSLGPTGVSTCSVVDALPEASSSRALFCSPSKSCLEVTATDYRGFMPNGKPRLRWNAGERASGVFEDVVVEHPVDHFLVVRRDVVVHVGVFLYVVEF